MNCDYSHLCKSCISVFFLKADFSFFVFRSEEGSSQIFLPFVCVSIKVTESSPDFCFIKDERKFVRLTMFAAVQS